MVIILNLLKIIDKQDKKKSYIFNNSTDTQGIPAGYDGKILEHKSDSSINVQSKMNMGAYKTKIVLFDAYNCKYEVIEQTAEEVKKNVELAGKDYLNLMKNLKVIKKIIQELLYIWLIVEHFLMVILKNK